jgi:hypothetical protein
MYMDRVSFKETRTPFSKFSFRIVKCLDNQSLMSSIVTMHSIHQVHRIPQPIGSRYNRIRHLALSGARYPI